VGKDPARVSSAGCVASQSQRACFGGSSRWSQEPRGHHEASASIFSPSAVRAVHVSRVAPHLFTGRWFAHD
jgi:hypothetical protein